MSFLPARCRLKHLIPNYCQALFLYDRVLLAGVAYWVQPLFSCNSTAATPTSDACILGTSSCSRYSLSSEYTRSCASFHCTCSDLPFLRRLDREAETSSKAGMWSLSRLLLGGRLLTISLEFSSVLQMASVKTHFVHLESQTLFCTNPLDQPVSASILWSSRSWTGISCHWADVTGLQLSSWVLGLLQ